MNKKIDIVGLGYCGQDYLCILPRIPYDEKVEIIDHMLQGGGPAATAIATAAKLGASAGFIGAVGDDDNGRRIINDLREKGVDVSRLIVQDNAVSPTTFCWIEKNTGKRSIAWTRGGIMSLSANDIDPKYISSAKILHLDGHHTKAAIFAAGIAQKNGTKVSLDAGTILPDIDKVIALTDILITSEFFALKYTGKVNIPSAAKELLAMGPGIVVITSGEKGCYGLTKVEEMERPAFNVNVVDTTGAGDVFHGAFIFAYLQGLSFKKTLEFSCAVSALKCMKFGGRAGIPTKNKTIQFLKDRGVKLSLSRGVPALRHE